jgi:AraC family transcriptional regulator, regulatory protein of adaptative response / methylated-DNA-[protein]-cysteine methyltransferase
MATMSVVPKAMWSGDRMAAIAENEAWERVLARDASADGGFVYAVASTGVYCRPGCPSRRPARENVRFFASREEAEMAGFRACLRCKPNLAGAVEDPQAAQVARGATMLREAAGEAVSLQELTKAAGLGRFALLRAFKRVLGVTPAEFARAQRRERFRAELKRGTVTEAVYSAGFGSSSRMYENSREMLGMRPSMVKSGGDGVVIRWTTAGSPLGRMLVASTEQGLCAVMFGDSDEEVEEALRERFSKAELRRDDPALGEAVQMVLAEMSESAAAGSLPFDVRATAFQHRVWEALRAIPRGETRTYGQIAQSIGAPKAVRAVGAACGANPLAILVPCHRAVGANGSLTGYRWGVERKRKLLAMERGGEATAGGANR